MRVSRQEVRSSTHGLPEIRFEDHDLTSFSGLVILQALSNGLQLRKLLQDYETRWKFVSRVLISSSNCLRSSFRIELSDIRWSNSL